MAAALEEMNMTEVWSTPEICEVSVGMEVTAYASAEI
jgi:coenzyme PQQ precursor peptide PqqA